MKNSKVTYYILFINTKIWFSLKCNSTICCPKESINHFRKIVKHWGLQLPPPSPEPSCALANLMWVTSLSSKKKRNFLNNNNQNCHLAELLLYTLLRINVIGVRGTFALILLKHNIENVQVKTSKRESLGQLRDLQTCSQLKTLPKCWCWYCNLIFYTEIHFEHRLWRKSIQICI